MECRDNGFSMRSRKRKLPEGEVSTFPLDELNQDLLERVLSRLPTSSFFRVSSVCKRWRSAANSTTFRLACSEITSRDPWFFMIDSESHFDGQPIVFDSTEKCWKQLNFLPLLHWKQSQNPCSNFVPVAASGGLICFHNAPNEFIVCNPVTGSWRQLPSLKFDSLLSKPLQAIAMISRTESFELVLISGEFPSLSLRTYNSSTNEWGEDITLIRRISNPTESDTCAEPELSDDDDDDPTVYFLSKCGNVVSTDLQRSPCKQYSSVIARKDDENVLYFLSSSGTIFCCNLAEKSFFEYPRILPAFSEYSIDLVECGGEMFVVVLSEFLETASLRVWKFDEKIKSWHQTAAMPPAISHEFYGKKVDINCTGAGFGQILVCVSSEEICRYVLCDLGTDKWCELPDCYMNGRLKEFACAFSFEPRIEASP